MGKASDLRDGDETIDRGGDARSEEAAREAAAHHQGSIVSRAVRGAFWMVLSGSGARVLGILGTLAVTRFLAPEEYGEVSLAALIIQIANLVTNGGISQYIAARPKAGREVIFHATFYYVVIGVVGLAATVLFGDWLGAWLHAPGIVKHLPAIAFASMLERVAVIQDRVQLRSMRFRSVGVQRSLGELVYSAVSVGLAALAAGTPYGGANAIVWASVARSVLRLITLSLTTPRRDWLEPHKLDWKITREIFAFGLPMAVVTIAGFGSQKFDNIVFQFHFGLAWLTFYNLAYNFADMPAALIGEQIGDVLVPSFAHMEDDGKRRDALLLALRMLLLLVIPMTIGLATVAPTLGKLAFPVRYQEGIIKVLRILALFSIARTVTWVANSYLQVRNRPRMIMALETGRMLGIIVLMNAFILIGMRTGPGHAVKWACWSVVTVFALSGVSYMWAIRRLDGVSIFAQLVPFFPPALPCIPMVLAVRGVRWLIVRFGLFTVGHPVVTAWDQIRVFAPRVAVEIVVGAVVFVISAFVLTPKTSREFVRLIRNAVQKRRGSGAEGAAPASEAPAAVAPQ
ncbi:MAG: oligosaccharide flippase family protein [Minicystis sp.]